MDVLIHFHNSFIVNTFNIIVDFHPIFVFIFAKITDLYFITSPL